MPPPESHFLTEGKKMRWRENLLAPALILNPGCYVTQFNFFSLIFRCHKGGYTAVTGFVLAMIFAGRPVSDLKLVGRMLGRLFSL